MRVSWNAYVREFHHQMHINFPKVGKIIFLWPVLVNCINIFLGLSKKLIEIIVKFTGLLLQVFQICSLCRTERSPVDFIVIRSDIQIDVIDIHVIQTADRFLSQTNLVLTAAQIDIRTTVVELYLDLQSDERIITFFPRRLDLDIPARAILVLVISELLSDFLIRNDQCKVAVAISIKFISELFKRNAITQFFFEKSDFLCLR